MAKRLFRLVALLLVPIICVSFVLTSYNRFLDEQIDLKYNSALGRTYGVDEMNKGIKLLSHNANKDDLIILGSSELDSKVPQNPQHMFPNTQLESDVNLVGRAYVQSLLDAVKIGALSEDLENKKLVLVVSLQWFLGDEINKDGFKAHFSEIQFYKMMRNKNLDKEIKKYICERTVKLAANESLLERPYLYAYLYAKDNFVSKTVLKFFEPYYFIREKFLDLKDKHDAYKAIKKFENEPKQNTRSIDWVQEEIDAQKMGESACTNNDFYVYDEYYTTYLEPNIDALKESSKNTDLFISNEFKDYEIFLKTCKELKVKPYIVFMSTNGLYYDYIGISKETRLAFYDKLAEMANEYGFDYLDLRDKEYKPYFFKDVMHLGWKGWLYVNKKIAGYYSQNN